MSWHNFRSDLIIQLCDSFQIFNWKFHLLSPFNRGGFICDDNGCWLRIIESSTPLIIALKQLLLSTPARLRRLLSSTSAKYLTSNVVENLRCCQKRASRRIGFDVTNYRMEFRPPTDLRTFLSAYDLRLKKNKEKTFSSQAQQVFGIFSAHKKRFGFHFDAPSTK